MGDEDVEVSNGGVYYFTYCEGEDLNDIIFSVGERATEIYEGVPP